MAELKLGWVKLPRKTGFKLSRRRLKRRIISCLVILGVILAWGSLLTLILLVSPEGWSILALFFFIFSCAVYLTSLIFWRNKYFSLLTMFFLTLLLLLQLFRQLHWLNLALLIAFCLAILFHWRRLDKI